MKYVITMTDIEGQWDSLSKPDQDAVLERFDRLKEKLTGAGVAWDILHLLPRHEAKTVRMSATGVVAVEDGPYSSADEYAGGFLVIEVDSEDEAVEWAKEARFLPGANEVRRVWE
jgi:hypothetical protein